MGTSRLKQRSRAVVTDKRGKPIARLVPIAGDEECEREILAELRTKLRLPRSEAELLQPTSELAKGRDAALLR